MLALDTGDKAGTKSSLSRSLKGVGAVLWVISRRLSSTQKWSQIYFTFSKPPIPHAFMADTDFISYLAQKVRLPGINLFFFFSWTEEEELLCSFQQWSHNMHDYTRDGGDLFLIFLSWGREPEMDLREDLYYWFPNAFRATESFPQMEFYPDDPVSIYVKVTNE